MKELSKALKTILSVLLCVFTLVILLALTVIAVEIATNYTFFINGVFSVYRVSPKFIVCLGVFGDACVVLTVLKKRNAKLIFSVLSVAVIVLAVFAGLTSLLFNDTVERRFYHESSPDGENEIIVSSYQFLVASGGEVYYRVNPLFIRRLNNEDGQHVEWFYDDYTVEWYDDRVIIDGHTYLMPEK